MIWRDTIQSNRYSNIKYETSRFSAINAPTVPGINRQWLSARYIDKNQPINPLFEIRTIQNPDVNNHHQTIAMKDNRTIPLTAAPIHCKVTDSHELRHKVTHTHSNHATLAEIKRYRVLLCDTRVYLHDEIAKWTYCYGSTTTSNIQSWLYWPSLESFTSDNIACLSEKDHKLRQRLSIWHNWGTRERYNKRGEDRKKGDCVKEGSASTHISLQRKY